MTISERLALMDEINARNNERWDISTEEQEAKQTAVEYSYIESMMGLYIQ